MRKLSGYLMIFFLIYSCAAEPNSQQLISESLSDKYQRIDDQLKEIQADLPKDDGKEWIWVSMFRDKNTIILKYQESELYKGGFDPEYRKKFIIEYIQRDPEVLADQMNFKLIHIFSDGKVETINIYPDEYNN